MFLKDRKTKKISLEKIDSEEKIEEEELKPVKKGKKKFTTFELVFISTSIGLLGLVSGCLITACSNLVFGTNLNADVNEFLKTFDYVKKNYYEEVDDSRLMKAAISGMLGSLDDDFSYFMDEDFTDSFNTAVDGKYVGVGITIQQGEENTTIVDMFENSPATKADLKIGDIMYKVNGKDISKKTSSEIAGMISGDVGEIVTITVIRDGKEIENKLTLSEIEIPSVFTDIKEENDKKIGYIQVNNFASNTYKQFKSNLVKLEKDGIDSLIIDVRDNTGGHLTQVSSMLDLFFDKGTVLYQLKDKKKTEKFYAESTESRSYPVVILTNGDSASASELFAACFKEKYKDITLIGTKTYGKGTVQQQLDLSSGTSYKFTIQKWLTPDGNWIHKKGIEPDIVVELDKESETDNQLQKAIEELANK